MIFYIHILLLALFIIVKYIGGVMILTCMHLCSNANFAMHTSRGSLGYIFYFLYLYHANPYVVIKHQKGGDWKSISLNNVFWCLLTTYGGLTVLLKFCRLSRLIWYLADVHPKKEEKIRVWSLVVGLGLSCLVGCFAKVLMVERVSTKCCGCNF
jgi:hypothetical protein